MSSPGTSVGLVRSTISKSAWKSWTHSSATEYETSLGEHFWAFCNRVNPPSIWNKMADVKDDPAVLMLSQKPQSIINENTEAPRGENELIKYLFQMITLEMGSDKEESKGNIRLQLFPLPFSDAAFLATGDIGKQV